MFTKCLFLVLLYCFSIINGKPDKFFRKGYKYLDETKSFYKIHTVHKKWEDAKSICEMEGATLFYPQDEEEANAVISYWNATQTFLWIHIGISTPTVKEIFETVDDRPGLEQPQLVEEIQRYYLNTLRVYILNQFSATARCSVVFGKILSILSELRTLGMQNSNMCISLKLKNRKLPPFLEEIWDVADVSQPVVEVPADL